MNRQWYNTYDEVDQRKLLLEPHRDISGIFLYKTYDEKEALLLPCSCNDYGMMCEDCEVLNTSYFYGLKVPLNPEDFNEWKHFFLKEHQWTEENWYNWLSFWIRQLDNRHSYHQRLIFFSDEKFMYMSNHNFFYYLFNFTKSGDVFLKDPIGRPLPLDVKKRGMKIRNIRPDHITLITGDATIRFTYQLYKEGGRVKSIDTGFRSKSLIHFSYDKDARQETLSFYKKISAMEVKRWKRVFQYTLNDINSQIPNRNAC